MARRSAADKAETHQQIVRHAARAFREHGEAVGIGDVMRDLGLTHGGFYRHFESKEDLFVAAVESALDDVSLKLQRIAQKAPAGEELAAIIAAYLSPDHLAHPEAWCAIASLSPDLARQPAAVRKRLDAAFGRYVERIAPYLPGAGERERAAVFLVLFSGMAGAIAMIRSFGDRARRDQALALVREHYLRAYGGAGADGKLISL